jgi:hypothetical protein
MKSEKTAKTYIEKLGFKDDDLYEKNHDELMEFLVNNKWTLMEYILSKHDSYKSRNSIFYGRFPVSVESDEARYNKELRYNRFPIKINRESFFDIKKDNSLELEYCISNSYNGQTFVKGFLDAKLEFYVKVVDTIDEASLKGVYNCANQITKYYMTKKFQNVKFEPIIVDKEIQDFLDSKIEEEISDNTFLLVYFIEIKTKINSFGACLRELNYYKEQTKGSSIILFSNDDRYRKLFEEQGIIFITEKDINDLKLGNTNGQSMDN